LTVSASTTSGPDHVVEAPPLSTERRSLARISAPSALSAPVWERASLVVLLVVSAGLYMWKLDQNGWANAYYSAAIQAGQHDALAFFYGSSDWGNSISVDKPPLSLWVIGISVRLFGLNSWAILLPQALMTLGSTYLIYSLVRTCFPASAALMAGAIFATTPITVLLGRYNNPDPLMILLMLSALYASVRATARARARLIFLAAFLLGLGFLAKLLQAFLVLPAMVLIFLCYTLMPWRKKLLAAAAACAILVGTSLSWPLAVDLTPTSARPFVGGSQNNSMLDLIVGYNGINRVVQHEEEPMVALLPKELRAVDSDAGFFRLFNASYGQEIGWLLAAGIVSVLALGWLLFRRQLDRNQAILACASGVWMISTFAMLSFMGNSFHSYYTASLAPPLAICCGIGVHLLLNAPKKVPGRLAAVLSLIISAIFSSAVWRLGAGLPSGIGNVLMGIVLVSAAFLIAPAPWPHVERVAGLLAVIALMLGPLTCSVVTAATPQSGSNPLSGTVTSAKNTLSQFLDGVKHGDPQWATGLALGVAPSRELAETIHDADAKCIWAAATYPSQTAARFQLETSRPIMPLGGFAAQDPSPDLAQFQRWVASNQVCYLIEQPAQLEVPGNSPALLEIQAWVSSNFASQDIEGVTVYRLVK
jgi:4-amino-4-deoxy-L-arabinose transferase-like glycosyltransferase